MNIGTECGIIEQNIHHNLNWTYEFKVLRITIMADLKQLYELNLPFMLQQVQNIIQIWRRRNLTILGKVCVIKS